MKFDKTKNWLRRMSSTSNSTTPSYGDAELSARSDICTPDNRHAHRDGKQTTLSVEVPSAKTKKYSWTEEDVDREITRQLAPVWPPVEKPCLNIFEAWHAPKDRDEDEDCGIFQVRSGNNAGHDSDDESIGICSELERASCASSASSTTSADTPRSIWRTVSKPNIKLLRAKLVTCKYGRSKWVRPSRRKRNLSIDEDFEDNTATPDDASTTDETTTTPTDSDTSGSPVTTIATTVSDQDAKVDHNKILRTGVLKKRTRVDRTAELDRLRNLLFEMSPSLKDSLYLARHGFPLRIVGGYADPESMLSDK